MHVAVTGATGFLGRYIVNHLLSQGHSCRCWYRPTSDRNGFGGDANGIEWLPGRLDDPSAAGKLVNGVDAVVHAALQRKAGWNPLETDLLGFVQTNVLGSIRLMHEARSAGVERFVFVSTCAVHDIILDDRPLDEAHPLWPLSHYGAHKAAIEKFVHSFGLPTPDRAGGWGICALRPTGIYGLAHVPSASRWFGLVQDVVSAKRIDDTGGGKEVHASDVAKAVEILLAAEPSTIAGQAYNCCDMYIASVRVAQIAKELTASPSVITTQIPTPKHTIDTSKLQSMGMRFGGEPLLKDTVAQLVAAASTSQ